MRTVPKVYTFCLALTMMMFVPGIAMAGSPGGSKNKNCEPQSAADVFNEKKFARHSTLFRKAAEEAWHAAHNGDAPFESGFDFDKDGRAGRVQLSILDPGNRATHLAIVSSTSALGTLHVHNRFGEPTPSPGDIQSARMLGKVVYVESRLGLYAVLPNGTVRHVFNETDWFRKQCGN